MPKLSNCTERAYGTKSGGVRVVETCKISGTTSILIIVDDVIQGFTGNTPKDVANKLSTHIGKSKAQFEKLASI